MGVDVKLRTPKGLDKDKFLETCHGVPIDCEIEGGWIHFHFGYLGMDHIIKCTEFVKNFAKKYKVEIGSWSY